MYALNDDFARFPLVNETTNGDVADASALSKHRNHKRELIDMISIVSLIEN